MALQTYPGKILPADYSKQNSWSVCYNGRCAYRCKVHAPHDTFQRLFDLWLEVTLLIGHQPSVSFGAASARAAKGQQLAGRA